MNEFKITASETSDGAKQQQQADSVQAEFENQGFAITAAPGTAEYKQQINAYADSINVPQGPSY